MNLLIKNAWIVTGNDCGDVIPHGYITIENDTITKIHAGDPTDEQGFEIIDAENKVVAPGLVNAHMHCYSTFARGMRPAGSSSCFIEILEKLWWRLDKRLQTDDLYLSTLIPILEGIKSGVTTFIDHHASPNCIPNCLDILGKAFEDAGMRGILCYEVSDRDGEKIAQEGIEENTRFIEKHNTKQGLLKGTFGLHASFTVNKDTLEKAISIARRLGVGLHLHVAEDHADQTLTIHQNKKRVVHRLYDAGGLGHKTIAAHAVWVDDEEKRLLAETGTWVVHNPRSNMNNAVGAMDLLGHLRYGSKICLGTDGMSASIWPDLRTASLIHRHEHRDPRLIWSELETIVKNNNRLAQEFFPKKLGQIIPGAYADLVVYDYYPPTPLHNNNILGHFLFGFSHVTAETVIIAGNVVLRNHKFVHFKEAEIFAESRTQAEKFWQRFHA